MKKILQCKLTYPHGWGGKKGEFSSQWRSRICFKSIFWEKDFLRKREKLSIHYVSKRFVIEHFSDYISFDFINGAIPQPILLSKNQKLRSVLQNPFEKFVQSFKCLYLCWFCKCTALTVYTQRKFPFLMIQKKHKKLKWYFWWSKDCKMPHCLAPPENGDI